MKEMNNEEKRLEGQKHLTTEQTVIQALKFVLFFRWGRYHPICVLYTATGGSASPLLAGLSARGHPLRTLQLYCQSKIHL